MVTSQQISKFLHSFIQDVQLTGVQYPKVRWRFCENKWKHPGGAQSVSSSRHNLISKGPEYLKRCSIQHLLTPHMRFSLYIQMWPNTSTKWFEADMYNLTLSDAELLPPSSSFLILLLHPPTTTPPRISSCMLCNWAFRESGETIWPSPCTDLYWWSGLVTNQPINKCRYTSEIVINMGWQ